MLSSYKNELIVHIFILCNFIIVTLFFSFCVFFFNYIFLNNYHFSEKSSNQNTFKTTYYIKYKFRFKHFISIFNTCIELRCWPLKVVRKVERINQINLYLTDKKFQHILTLNNSLEYCSNILNSYKYVYVCTRIYVLYMSI